MNHNRAWMQAARRRGWEASGAVELTQGYFQPLNDIGHAAILGPSGTGKTTFCNRLILKTALSPNRVTTVVFDPHGSAAREMLGHFHRCGMPERVAWIDFSEPARACGYNPLAVANAEDIPSQADNVVSVLLAAQELRQVDSIMVMPQLRRSYKALVQGLMEAGLTLGEGVYLLTDADPAIRQRIIDRMKTPMIKAYWEALEPLKPAHRARELGVTLARLDWLYTNPHITRIVSQNNGGLNVPKLLESGRTILVTGQPGRTLAAEQLNQLLALLFSSMTQYVFARDAGDGMPVIFFVDEVRDGICPASELSRLYRGGRKYGATLWIGTQSIANLLEQEPDVAHEILVNSRTKVIFGDCAAADLEILAKECALESLDFKAIKEDLYRRGFAPEEVERIVRSITHGESDTDGTFESSGSMESASGGESVMPLEGGLFPMTRTVEHSGGASGSSSSSGSMHSHTDSYSESVSRVPFTRFQEYRELASREFRAIEEQYEMVKRRLKHMGPRMLAVKQRGKTLHFARSPHWPDLGMPASWFDEKIQAIVTASPWYATVEKIEGETNQRRQTLIPQTHATKRADPISPTLTATGDDDDNILP